MDKETLRKFEKNRDIIIETLRNNPRIFAETLYSEKKSGMFWDIKKNTYSPYLSTNEIQLCCLIGLKSEIIRPNICAYSTVKSLDNQGKKSQTKLVTTGNIRNPDHFILKIYNLNNLSIKYFNESQSNIKYLNGISQIAQCFYPDLYNLKYLGSDSFTNEYLIGFILNEIYKNNKLDGCIQFISSSICDNGSSSKGTIIMNFAKFGDVGSLINNPLNQEFSETKTYYDVNGNLIKLNSLKPKIIIDIIKQVVVNLDFLQKNIQFNHGDFKIGNVLIDEKKSQGSYRGVTWNSSISLKIADFSTSSLTIRDMAGNPVRLFNYSRLASNYLNIFPFKPSIATQFDEPYYILDNNFNVGALTNIRHSGIPFYYSFDLYTFIISLLIVPEVYFPIMTDVALTNSLFNILWFQDDYSIIWSRLYDAMSKRTTNSYDSILNIITGIKLKCQLSDILISSLQKI